ncbi:MAG: lytic transglycosylase domain-containing protein [Dongiaceae bacterium]
MQITPGTRGWIRRLAGAAAIAGLTLGSVPPAQASGNPESPAPAAPQGDWTLCSAEIAEVEAELGIPSLLLQAISTVESGRWEKSSAEKFAWPWTVMAEGRGRYLPTKAAAIAEVETLQAAGVRNIDVGCMQVNLKHHPDAFASLEEAFDPATNVAYAAAFLRALKNEQQSWVKAVGSYHSRTPAFYVKYRAKVFAAWRDERRDQRQQERALAAQAKLGLVESLGFRHAGPVPPTITAWAE